MLKLAQGLRVHTAWLRSFSAKESCSAPLGIKELQGPLSLQRGSQDPAIGVEQKKALRRFWSLHNSFLPLCAVLAASSHLLPVISSTVLSKDLFVSS